MTTRKPLIIVTAGAILTVLVGTTACTMSTDPPRSAAAVATDTVSVTHEQNDRVPGGAEWTQHYFPSSDGSDVELHADVLLPEGLAEGEKVPIILSAGAYFGHSGQMSDEEWDHTGPSVRFDDLAEEGKLFERGYGLVMVDVRGFGGSTGCLDFIGAGEQADIKAAIEWSADQPWSTGAVGMYGKSYDAITGLVGNNLDLDPLKAVVAQEPMWDLKRNIWSNGVPRSTMVTVPGEYNKYAQLPALPDDDEHYNTNAAYEATHPECLVLNQLGYETSDPQSDYWKLRDLATGAAGTDTPLFFTQGTLEWNTEAEAVQTFLENHEGPEHGWLGPWDHFRGNDRTEDGRLRMGREGWFDEVFSFYDEHLKGVAPTVDYPAISVQDNTGAWRAQDNWPIADTSAELELRAGAYIDDGAENAATLPQTSFANQSAPVAAPTRIVGTPRIALQSEGQGNVMVKLYDVAPDGTAVAFDEQASVLRPGSTEFELRSTDWTLKAGHSLAVTIGTIQPSPLSGWVETPSHTTIQVNSAKLTLALDDPADDTPTEGDPAVYLEGYLKGNVAPYPAGDTTFTLPSVG